MTDKTTANGKTHGAFLIDDHPLIRIGLAQLLDCEPDLEVCGESGKSEGVIEAVQAADPDVVITDLSLPGASGLELIKNMRAAGVSVPILVVSMHEEEHYAERALKAGANGYVMKHEVHKNYVKAIRQVLEGEVYLSEAMTKRLVSGLTNGRPRSGSPVQELTHREFEVFELIGHGRSTRQIAAALKINPRTVDVHRANIKSKLGVQDGAELARYAVRWVEMAVQR
jgi:DNA-binding NarL/FixJ family response regulator